MLENFLIVGKSADWLPRTEGGVTAGAGTQCSHGIKDAVFGHGSSMQSAGARESRQSEHKGLYLPFVPNGINYVDSQGLDVISFNFSGCIMAVYEFNGSRRVCHVSTGVGQDCKLEWDRIKGLSQNARQFLPHEGIELVPHYSGCYGLITACGNAYSVIVSMNLKSGSSKYLVADVKKMSLS